MFLLAYLSYSLLVFFQDTSLFRFSHEPENHSECSSETASSLGSPEPAGKRPGWGQLQPAAADATAAAADGEGETALEAARVTAAGEATG